MMLPLWCGRTVPPFLKKARINRISSFHPPNAFFIARIILIPSRKRTESPFEQVIIKYPSRFPLVVYNSPLRYPARTIPSIYVSIRSHGAARLPEFVEITGQLAVTVLEPGEAGQDLGAVGVVEGDKAGLNHTIKTSKIL